MLQSQAAAQGTKVRAGASSYFGSAKLNAGAAMGADLIGRYIPTDAATIYSDEYIAVEVGVFAPQGTRVNLKDEQFQLVVNGHALTPQPPGVVTLVGNFPEMTARPQIVLDGSADGRTVEVGGAERKPRFPNDDPAHTPAAPRVPPVSTDPSGGEVKPRSAPKSLDDVVQAATLPEGDVATPVSGYLFFAYEGNIKKIKHAELTYSGPLGSASLKLR